MCTESSLNGKVEDEVLDVLVADAIQGALSNGIHGDDDLGIVVWDGGEISELTLPHLFVRNEIGHLDIEALTLFLANEVDLLFPEFVDPDFIARHQEVHVDYILEELVDVSGTVSNQGVAYLELYVATREEGGQFT